MKLFIGILIVICALIASAWYFYDPYLKPYLEGDGSGGITATERVIGDESSTGGQKNTSQSQVGGKTLKPSDKVGNQADAKSSKPAVAKSEIDILVEKKYPMPQIIPLMDIVKNWTAVPANAFPSEIIAKEPVAFDLVVNGQKIGSSSVAPGTPLKPARLAGDQLTVTNPTNPSMTRQIPVDQTDFKQRIQKRYDDFVAKKQQEIDQIRARAKQTLMARPEQLAALKGGGSKAVASSNPDSDPRLAPVKRSLADGELPMVRLEEARSYQWNGREEVKGDFPGSYDTVTVNFLVDTIFGHFPLDMKCLLQGGRVVAWVDPITEEKP